MLASRLRLISSLNLFGVHRYYYSTQTDAHSLISQHIKSDPVFMASKSYCPYCKASKQLLSDLGAKPVVIELDHEENGDSFQHALYEISGQSTVPNIFIGGKHIGGNNALQKLQQQNELHEVLKEAGAIQS